MSGQITREVGEKLYLQSQLYDLEASLPLRIIAEVLNNVGVLLGTSELSHTSKGVFMESTYVMPAEDVIHVKYYTYDPDGVTLNAGYVVVEERYMLFTASASASATIVIGDAVSGALDASELSGTINEEAVLIGSILDDDTVQGSIEEDSVLIGEDSDEC